jgi:hypothetical protein
MPRLPEADPGCHHAYGLEGDADDVEDRAGAQSRVRSSGVRSNVPMIAHACDAGGPPRHRLELAGRSRDRRRIRGAAPRGGMWTASLDNRLPVRPDRVDLAGAGGKERLGHGASPWREWTPRSIDQVGGNIKTMAGLATRVARARTQRSVAARAGGRDLNWWVARERQESRQRRDRDRSGVLRMPKTGTLPQSDLGCPRRRSVVNECPLATAKIDERGPGWV